MNAGNLLFTIDDGVLTEYHGPGGNVTIPEGVRVIGQRAFLSCATLRTVTIPEGVEEIAGDFLSETPSGAFSACTALTSVTLPQSLREIGCWAFSGCTGLKSIQFPAGLKRIANRAFQNCSGLREIVIPEGVTEMDYGVFMGCTGLRNVELPRNLTVIREYAFADCAALEQILFPPFLRTIDYCAFHGCQNLRAAVMPNLLTDIAGYAFEDCAALTNVTIGKSVEKIGDHAFRGCTNLTIRTRAGSVAEIYAQKHKIPCVTYESLRDIAADMLRTAYVPYSHFPVGAALECEDGTVFAGCNVEAASYPAGMCAERNALGQAVAHGQRRFSRIVIAGKGRDFCMPCGICRQALAEFSPDMEVVCLNAAGEEQSYFLRELLPHSFGPASLQSGV